MTKFTFLGKSSRNKRIRKLNEKFLSTTIFNILEYQGDKNCLVNKELDDFLVAGDDRQVERAVALVVLLV